MAPSCPGCGYVLRPPVTVAAPVQQKLPGTLSTEAQILIEQRITNEGPSAGVAYALWFFLGLLGGHRFYLGRAGSGVLMALLSITIIGLISIGIWWVVDAFLIPDMLREERGKLRDRLTGVASGAISAANPYDSLPSYHDPTAAKPG